MPVARGEVPHAQTNRSPETETWEDSKLRLCLSTSAVCSGIPESAADEMRMSGGTLMPIMMEIEVPAHVCSTTVDAPTDCR